MTEAVIVAGARTAVGRAKKGTLRHYRAEDMAAEAVKEAWKRAGDLDKALVDDVAIGCAFPEGSQGLNMARPVTMNAGSSVKSVNPLQHSAAAASRVGKDRPGMMSSLKAAGSVGSLPPPGNSRNSFPESRLHAGWTVRYLEISESGKLTIV